MAVSQIKGIFDVEANHVLGLFRRRDNGVERDQLDAGSRDPDGHMLGWLDDLIMLDKEPRPDLGIIPWSEWFDQNKS